MSSVGEGSQKKRRSQFNVQTLAVTNDDLYRCPCGKSYLSYCALYTHIRIKHAGKVLALLNAGTWGHNSAQERESDQESENYINDE